MGEKIWDNCNSIINKIYLKIIALASVAQLLTVIPYTKKLGGFKCLSGHIPRLQVLFLVRHIWGQSINVSLTSMFLSLWLSISLYTLFSKINKPTNLKNKINRSTLFRNMGT